MDLTKEGFIRDCKTTRYPLLRERIALFQSGTEISTDIVRLIFAIVSSM